MHSSIGKKISIRGADYISASRSEIGFVLYGPYQNISSGYYIVEFNIHHEDVAHLQPSDLVCKLDIVYDLGREIVGRRDVSVTELMSSGDTAIRVPFSISSDTENVEFRVWSTGKAKIAVAVERRVKVADRIEAERSGLPSTLHDNFFKSHEGSLRHLLHFGANFEPIPGGALVSFSGLNVAVRHHEDFQVISEVLINNVYRIIPIRDSIVIDVGMNIGVASIFYANQSWARKVYSFEPFREPFDRSKETFDLNPALKHKIVARNAGLSDENYSPVVHYRSETSIAGAIRDLNSGPVQKLDILDAGDVFRDICEEAQAAGAGVIVKLDCEGSEFPIMRRLDELGLLKHIDAFSIEWHKTWSPDVSVADLTRPLHAEGFVVFDQTVDADLHAGMLYAVRTLR